MENREPTKYDFRQIESGLLAFCGNFEKRLNEIYPDIPVFVIDTGDETYLFRDKFEHSKEKYLQVPRIILGFESAEFLTDQDTNQYVKMFYRFNDETYKTQVRRKAASFPVTCNVVCANFLKALQYFEVLSSILCIDNVYSYVYNGINYTANYNMSSITMEKNPMDIGGTKNFVIKINIDLILQLWLIKYHTIELMERGGNKSEYLLDLNGQIKLDENGFPILNPDFGNSGNINGIGTNLTPKFQIESENNIETYTTTIKDE